MALEDLNIPPQFWQMVAAATREPEAWRSVLEGKTRSELNDFYWYFERAMLALQDDDDFLDAFEDLSEDGIDDMCRYAVARGEDFYRAAAKDPSSLPEVDGHEPELQVLSDLMDVYYDRFDEPPPEDPEGEG